MVLKYETRQVLIIVLLFISSCSPYKLDRERRASSTKDENPYFSVSLDPNDQLHFFWKLHYDLGKVEIELRANLDKEQWMAVGFSDYGEQTNADVCIYWIDENGRPHFQDGWTDGQGFLSTEETNNCKLLNRKMVKGPKGKELHILYSREFDTCDDKDYIIEDGTTHIIYSMGTGKRRAADGIRLTDGNHGFARVQLLKTITPKIKFPDDTINVKFLNNKVKVPNVETTYWCSLHKLPPMPTKNHLIKFGPHIQPGSEPLVHHMELFHCEVDGDTKLPDWNGPCMSPDKPAVLEPCKRVISAWATGAEALEYPEEAGEPIGGPGYSPYVMLEVHYNNPKLKAGLVDSSGIDFYFTPTLRKYDAGTMELGLEYTDKMAIPPGQRHFNLDSYCVPECTRVGIAEGGINVFASQLHTHLTGVKIWTKHVRGGVELPELNRDNHYSSHFQEIRKLKNVVTVQPGDALITTCTYKTVDRKNVTLGGFSISDEMCVNYIHYYPRGNLEVCKSSIDDDSLKNYFKHMHSYAGQPTSPDKGINANYHSIQWSQLNADNLKKYYLDEPLSMQCNQSSGDRFPGFWNGVPITEVRIPLPEPAKNCSKKP